MNQQNDAHLDPCKIAEVYELRCEETKDGNEWQICYSNIRIHYSNVFEYSDREIINN